MSLRFLPAAARRPAPWKNGGGSTTEVAVFPPGADLDAFDWRVSLAEVATSGPFSVFPGIDRTLCLLSGAGVTLGMADAEASLTPVAPVCRFPGDLATSAGLHAGPISDLNVMSRRERFAHTLERFRLVRDAELVSAAFTLVLALDGGLRVATADEEVQLSPGDAALLEGAPGRLSATEAADVFVVRLYPV